MMQEALQDQASTSPVGALVVLVLVVLVIAGLFRMYSSSGKRGGGTSTWRPMPGPDGRGGRSGDDLP